MKKLPYELKATQLSYLSNKEIIQTGTLIDKSFQRVGILTVLKNISDENSIKFPTMLLKRRSNPLLQPLVTN